MKRAGTSSWMRRVVATFLTGFFVILPVVITLAIMGWVGGIIRDALGAQSLIGGTLQSLGLTFVTNEIVASIMGWVLVLAAIWSLGLFIQAFAKQKVQNFLNATMIRIPLVGSIYKPVSQVVDMLKKDEKNNMEGMSVVFCHFGEQFGGGFLGLRPTEGIYRFGEQDCCVVYIPTSPVPMSGGIVFVPVGAVRKIDMSVDDLMQIYFSLGVLSPSVVPQEYRAATSK